MNLTEYMSMKMYSSEVIRVWYYCDDCCTEWHTEMKDKLNGFVCSYCSSTNTRFIGWYEDD